MRALRVFSFIRIVCTEHWPLNSQHTLQNAVTRRVLCSLPLSPFRFLLFISPFLLSINGLYAPITLRLVRFFVGRRSSLCNLTILCRYVCVCVCICCQHQKFMFLFRCLADSFCRFYVCFLFHFRGADECVMCVFMWACTRHSRIVKKNPNKNAMP